MTGADPGATQTRRETTTPVAKRTYSGDARRPRPHAKPGPHAQSLAMTWLTSSTERAQRAHNMWVSSCAVNGLALSCGLRWESVVSGYIGAKPGRQVSGDGSGHAFPGLPSVEF